jgi:hypothetical protein
MYLVTVLILAGGWLFQASSPVRNADFEDGQLNAAPPGWMAPSAVGTAGYSAVVTDETPATGSRCLVLASTTPSPSSFGNVMQMFDAAPYRGQRVTYRARVRTDQGSRAQLWLRVDRPGNLVGSFDNMGDRPITSTTWSEYRIEAEIAPDATVIAFGLLLPQAGRAWLDSVAMEFTTIDTGPVEPPRAIAGRGLDNLVAFTRLFGYVRYFHPSDEAAATDWDRFAIDGVRAIEAAATPQDLATKLDALFRPVAPTLSVFVGSKPPPLPAALSKPAAGAPRITSWKHTGVGASLPKPQMFQPYSSVRETRDAAGPEADPAAPLTFDLGGGVSARVPIALWTDGGTLPKSPKAEPPSPRGATAADRATRIADIIIAWNVFQHFYPYRLAGDTSSLSVRSGDSQRGRIPGRAATSRGGIERWPRTSERRRSRSTLPSVSLGMDREQPRHHPLNDRGRSTRGRCHDGGRPPGRDRPHRTRARHLVGHTAVQAVTCLGGSCAGPT